LTLRQKSGEGARVGRLVARRSHEACTTGSVGRRRLASE
jgi:hypothetical protein